MLDKNIKNKIFGREKTPFSLWKKVQKKRTSLEQMTDIIGFRVILENIDECYKALGVFHSNWNCIPGRFKDYISSPKINNYQSLHTAVIGPNKRPIEIYNILRKSNPSPFMFYFNYKDFNVLGSSPEILVRLRKGEVTIRPIAGTRPRGKNKKEDKKYESDLAYATAKLSAQTHATPVKYTYTASTTESLSIRVFQLSRCSSVSAANCS